MLTRRGGGVMAHGYALNHTALALHRLPPAGSGADINDFVRRLQAAGLELNEEGGLVKVSPDQLLLQCACMADRTPFAFADGGHRHIAAAYVGACGVGGLGRAVCAVAKP
ncbi:hypothetical protein TSOC_013431 [Tetrabaena socialis]|uniref:2-oxoadipate dioxygenase/decarboxylase n=1 Tax=Tetrabaena socialis TaxID=47790 RepID=A0A2J7ZKE4_9CHLO|nr:hypothetical protein TSOC_013431 [Tetrabaena socialis]|eukprot:PNH00733.1 hypothetical protein TSOC_013431 [Tetrabaena socialis]